jgi:hypothetical protein
MTDYRNNPVCETEGCPRHVKQADWTYCGPCNYERRTGRVAHAHVVTVDEHTFDGDTVRIQPKVVELGHHCRELQALTGMNVEDNQARRMLNDMASFAVSQGCGGEERALIANRWMTTVFEPIAAMVPPELRGKLEPAELFHEILEHRWYLSERAGHEVDIFETARDYFDSELVKKPDEVVAAPATPGPRPTGDAP